VFVTTEFEQGKLDTKVVFTARNEITGLFFVPIGEYESPSYVDSSSFDEIEITVGKGLWKLPGTLSLPKGDGPFPAVVLVHGSGPQDRDESIGPNKPFRDLAHGLASQGVAVLRYEKRTKHHRLKMALLSHSITVKEETVDDTVAAVEAVAAHKKIDGDKIFVLGHSLGGYVIPRIAKANGRITGFISLAGSTRPLEEMVIDQTKYILSLDGEITEVEQKYLDDIESQVENVRALESDQEAKKEDLPLGIPAGYWLDLRDYKPANEAAKIKKPMLFLQGDRDYQVTLEDFAGWQKTLGDRPDVKFIRYPSLNHLFVEGNEKSAPAEYSTPGNVAEAVVKDIAGWVKAQN
jgi:dienelactone hydrolase